MLNFVKYLQGQMALTPEFNVSWLYTDGKDAACHVSTEFQRWYAFRIPELRYAYSRLSTFNSFGLI